MGQSLQQAMEEALELHLTPDWVLALFLVQRLLLELPFPVQLA